MRRVLGDSTGDSKHDPGVDDLRSYSIPLVVVVRRGEKEVGRRRDPSVTEPAESRPNSIREGPEVLRNRKGGGKGRQERRNTTATTAGLPPELGTMARPWTARVLGKVWGKVFSVVRDDAGQQRAPGFLL